MDQLEKGLTLVELLLVIAILAIVAVAGYQLLGLIPLTQNSTSGTIFKEAVRQFTVQALSNAGAEMTWNGKGTLSIVSLGGNPVSKSYQLSPQVSITLNGKPFQCLILNPQGFPDNQAIAQGNSRYCSASNPTAPFIWSVSDGSYTLSFQ
ncbi:prepilin-type N-terminal cleavage/methylation domain-containing protein [Acidithiobacillus sp. CV18-2]|nr:prepilin-type N-terminal cleavage/methylation domain-containing protein [Acidithiobacillus sp. CV18-3]MBU2758355.1 prepilin-type N-terminal cleavage/methylation domain-containing protein [Acidithiobacillus sp. BN09-2]MBU2778220.1 prepilin-type N-terminal cleavage/methylation domain-containing protein [Acidithiobacillus sp. CV18-2]MBU2799093.1 prepilin-type N-terminal cleavage/methylation domain-containing protein [Acidithiobacillus sp. VAN18-4]